MPAVAGPPFDHKALPSTATATEKNARETKARMCMEGIMTLLLARRTMKTAVSRRTSAEFRAKAGRYNPRP